MTVSQPVGGGGGRLGRRVGGVGWGGMERGGGTFGFFGVEMGVHGGF